MNAKLLKDITAIDAKTLSRLFIILVALILTASLLPEVVDLINQSNNSHKTTKASSNRQAAQPVNHNYSGLIVEAAFFGTLKGNQLSDIKLPKTKLQLTLRGAFTAKDPNQGSAIIEGADKQAKHYKVGSTISPGTQLKAVYSDRIILTTNNNLETLYFPASDSSVAESNNQTSNNTNKSALTEQKRQELIKQRLEELRRRVKR